MKKICLIGFMGCGKTTIGMALAEKLNCQWTDLDVYITSVAGKSISDIFAKEGEQAFRQLEIQCLEEVLKAPYSAVISTGGGVISSQDNISRLQQVQTVFLDYPFDVLFDRIKGDTSRPLVTTYEALHKRYKERMPYYKAACSLQLACEGKRIQDIVEAIIKEFSL